jgi:hypothetical protein
MHIALEMEIAILVADILYLTIGVLYWKDNWVGCQLKDFENYNLQFHGLGDFSRPAQVHSIALTDYEIYSFFNA